MLKYLQISMAALILMASAILLVLWVRSYRAEDRASGNYSTSIGVRFYSSRGWVVCSKNTAQKYPWALELGSDFWLQPGDDRLNFRIPPDFFRGAAFASVSIPHWFLLLASVGLAATSWPRKPYGFSLRSLFIATTLVAIVLGLVAAM